MKEELLKIKNLWSGYKETNILKGINLVIKKGDFCGVVGPNGAGKTTLLKNITRILPLRRGKIFLKGREKALLSFAKNKFENFLQKIEEEIEIKKEEPRDEWALRPYNSPFGMGM